MMLEILNWEKFNPRKDLKSMPWFRLESDIGYSETLFGLDAETKWLWIFLLSTCARKVNANIEGNYEYISFHSGIEVEKVKKAIKVFENKGLVRVTNESDRVTNGSVPNKTNRTEQDEQNEQNTPNQETCSGAISVFDKNKLIANFLVNVKKSTQVLWVETYQDADWLNTEILKAMAWLDANPKKKPKGKNPARFLGNWFSRGWESYRKTLPSNKPNQDINLDYLDMEA